jgi:Ca2+-binding EF-hand superfamily protein
MHGNDSSDLVTSGIQEEIQQKSFSRHVNPRDPIHMNIRMAFLEFDTDLSGKITRDEFQKVCEKYKIEIDATTLDSIMKKYPTSPYQKTQLLPYQSV